MASIKKKLSVSFLRKAILDLSTITDDYSVVDYVRFKTTLVFRGKVRFAAPGIGLELQLVKSPAKGKASKLLHISPGDAFELVMHRTASGRFIETSSGAQFVAVRRGPDPRQGKSVFFKKIRRLQASIIPTKKPPPAPPAPPRPRRPSTPPGQRRDDRPGTFMIHDPHLF